MVRNIFLFICFCLLVSSSYVMAETVSGRVVMDVDLSAQAKGQEARLWIPYPVSDSDQEISNIKITGDYSESGVYTDRINKIPFLYAKWNKENNSRKLSFSWDVSRDSVSKKDLLKNKELPWNKNDYELYLKGTKLGPIDGDVKKIADRITKGKNTVIEKARAVYDWVCENTYRKEETKGCGPGDVCSLLKDPGGKCGDISSVYVAVARAAGVPTREVFGLRLGKTDGQDLTGSQHCWAEFLAPGIGWIPLDPADVRKMMLKENLKYSDAKTKEYIEKYWASIEPFRVRLSEGRDIVLNPRQSGEPVNYLMYPFAQIGGNTIDWLNSSGFKYSIVWKKIEQ